jgi:hypothetical protein
MDATRSLAPFPDGDSDFRTAYYAEPTIDELLTDPMTRSLMKADHVDTQDFERMLHSVASRFQTGVRLATQPNSVPGEADARARSLVPDPLRRALVHSRSAPPRLMPGSVAAVVSLTACGSHCAW